MGRLGRDGETLSQEIPLNREPQDEHEGYGDDESQDRIDSQIGEERIGDVARQDDQVPMGEVDQPHDAENKRKAQGDEGIQAAQHNAYHNGGNEVSRSHPYYELPPSTCLSGAPTSRKVALAINQPHVGRRPPPQA